MTLKKCQEKYQFTNSKTQMKTKQKWNLNEPRHTLSSLFRFFYFFQTKNCQRTYKEIIAFLPFFPSLKTRKRCCTYYLLQCRLSVPILYFPEINQNPLSNFPTVILTSRGTVVRNFITNQLLY